MPPKGKAKPRRVEQYLSLEPEVIEVIHRRAERAKHKPARFSALIIEQWYREGKKSIGVYDKTDEEMK